MNDNLRNDIIKFYSNYQMTIALNDINIVINDKELMLTINFKKKKIKHKVLEKLQEDILKKFLESNNINLIRFKIEKFIIDKIINFKYNSNDNIIIKFFDGSIDTLKFENTTSIACKSKTFNKCIIDKILINKCRLKEVNFDINSKLIKKIKIIDTTFNETNLLSSFKIITNEINDLIIENSYINFDFNIYSQDTQNTTRARVNLNNILITDSKFKRSINLSKLNIIEKIYIKNTEFMSNLSFNKSITKECTFDAVIFDTLSTNNFNEFKIINTKETDRNTLRIIKSHLENQHNKIEANIYHSYELKAREIELEKVNFWNNFNDKVIFKFNNIISEHGLKWHIPLFWIFLIGLYYSAYLMSGDNISISEGKLLLIFVIPSGLIYILHKAFNNQISSSIYIICLLLACIYYYIINGFNMEPLIRFISIIDFTVNENITFTERSISKLIMGVLIYHLIIAFRKDTRQ